MTTPVKCLLVDDLEDNLLVLQALLRDNGVELLLARSGVEALNLLLDHEVALALVDVQMPEMDGFELAELMRGSERTRHVPIIFVTAGVRDQHRVFRGYESGAVDFLYKPIDPVILKNKAEVFFQLYRQKQQIALELQARTETLRLNETFTAVLGHDLRSPLNAMVMSAQAVVALSQETQTREAAMRIVTSGMRMNRMIADLLDLARARLGGGIPVAPQPADLTPILQRVVQEQKGIHPARHLDVRVSGDVMANWDADRIAQVLSNVIGNALQHGDAEAPVVVEVDGTCPGEVAITVRNRGAIAPETLRHIFDPFRAGSDRTAPSAGLGLGLYIARQIVQAHGGQISAVASEAGATAFSIRVPRIDPQIKHGLNTD